MAELEAAVASSKSKMKFDSVNYARYESLRKQNATTGFDYDRMKLTYENSKNDYKLALSRLEKTKNQLRLEYENAQKQLEIAGEESGRYLVKSEINGTLFSTTKELNELVRRGEVLAVAGDSKDFYLRLSVDEIDVRKVKVGQSVLVKLEAYPNQVFRGKVTKIFPLIDTRQQSLQVEATLDENLPGWFSGLSAEANIVIQEKEKTLVIPKSFVQAGDSLWIKTDGKKQKVKIKRGIETMEEVEILEGISADTEIVAQM